MTKRIAAKYKIDRRLGCNLWGRPKSPFKPDSKVVLAFAEDDRVN